MTRQVDRVAQAEAEVQSALWDLQREIMCLDLLLSNADIAATSDRARRGAGSRSGRRGESDGADRGGA
ncbi:hypothetical protein [Phytoactinopolyspora limicola]|uniref:hypothetical protein n=1 Tax=Phytoactinopolyspora limicola TaxID=2715536 RepID=UPI00140DD17D|nr:hypothetical protein [Phytoactinopolyspora limicola]